MRRQIIRFFGALLASICLMTSGVASGAATASTFRLVKPPQKGAKKLITIQILPQGGIKPAPPKIDVPAGDSLNAWFWDRISPDIAARSPGRFGKALAVVASSPADQRPHAASVSALSTMIAKYGTDILVATLGKKVSPALILTLAVLEPDSHASISRLITDTGATPVPSEKIILSGAGPSKTPDFAALANRFVTAMARDNNDPILALAAYQAGNDAVDTAQGVPANAASRSFVPRVLATFLSARALCATPPELYSDGCVFLSKGSK